MSDIRIRKIFPTSGSMSESASEIAVLMVKDILKDASTYIGCGSDRYVGVEYRIDHILSLAATGRSVAIYYQDKNKEDVAKALVEKYGFIKMHNGAMFLQNFPGDFCTDINKLSTECVQAQTALFNAAWALRKELGMGNGEAREVKVGHE